MKIRVAPVVILVTAAVCSAHAADEPTVQPRRPSKVTIPVIRLSGAVVEKPVPEDLPFNLSGTTTVSLRSLLDQLEKIRTDDRVPAMVLEVEQVGMSWAQLEEVARALREIRAAGKKIHVNCELFTTGGLALMSNASEISMVPTGYMFITGLYGEQVFLRGLLDKLGVVPDYFTCGDYKSAAEMFMRKEPSREAAEMTNWLFDGMYERVLKTIADGRKTDTKTVRNWIDTGVYTAETAIKAGIIDRIEHHQDFEARLKELYGADLKFDRRYGRKASQKIDLSSPFGLLNFYAELLAPSRPRKSTTPAVGIVYLEGAIMPGSSGGNPLLADSAAFSDEIRKALDEAAEDDAIKAVVFRINSPGGSAVASEVILNAARRVAARKPLVVSMGSVAASGGYYVSCGCDTIFAEGSTITGSIGVVAGKFATTQMWNKLGINFVPVERGEKSAMLSSIRVFTDAEREAMQGYMNAVYDVFKGHVTRVRGDRLKKPIDEIAGGRVYTGQQALELGLVDHLGGLDDAIAFVAQKAGLTDTPEVRTIPRPRNFMELLMSDLTGQQDDGRHLSLSVANSPLLKTALPLLRDVDPVRAQAIKQALLQLAVIQHERLSLTAPVLNFR